MHEGQKLWVRLTDGGQRVGRLRCFTCAAESVLVLEAEARFGAMSGERTRTFRIPLREIRDVRFAGTHMPLVLTLMGLGLDAYLVSILWSFRGFSIE